MLTRRFERIALAQFLMGTLILGLIEHAPAQPVNPPTPRPAPTFNPSSPNTVPQPSYRPSTPCRRNLTANAHGVPRLSHDLCRNAFTLFSN